MLTLLTMHILVEQLISKWQTWYKKHNDFIQNLYKAADSHTYRKQAKWYFSHQGMGIETQYIRLISPF